MACLRVGQVRGLAVDSDITSAPLQLQRLQSVLGLPYGANALCQWCPQGAAHAACSKHGWMCQQ
jgi:hypothetical protein